jgi:Methyltransferase domain
MPTLSNFDLYELAVTNPGPLAALLHAAWNGSRRVKPVLREDFSGSGALARHWAGSFGPAIAVDRDAAAIRACGKHANLETVKSDVMTCRRKADIIAATNFAAGYWHDRASLVKYLAHCRRMLNKGGLLCCDLYGGSDAFVPGVSTVKLRGPAGERVEYHWEQVEARPQTGRVLNAIHFRVGKGKLIRNAFTYDWRLWSIPELKDAMLEAGFRSVHLYDRLGDAIDSDGNLLIRELAPDEEMDDPYVVYVIAK